MIYVKVQISLLNSVEINQYRNAQTMRTVTLVVKPNSVYSNNQLVVVVLIKKPVPLFILMRNLILSDKNN